MHLAWAMPALPGGLLGLRPTAGTPDPRSGMGVAHMVCPMLVTNDRAVSRRNSCALAGRAVPLQRLS